VNITNKKSENKQKIIFKEVTRFAENKLICFKIHEIQFTNNNLMINQINIKLDINTENKDFKNDNDNMYFDTKNNNRNFENNPGNYLNVYNNETIKLSDCANFLKFEYENKNLNNLPDYQFDMVDKSLDSSYFANESVDMSKLNIFTDENFLTISKKNTKENQNLQAFDYKTENSNNTLAMKKTLRKNLNENIQINLNNNCNNNNSYNKNNKDGSGSILLNISKQEILSKTFNNNNHLNVETQKNSKGILHKNIPFVSRYDLIPDCKFYPVMNVNQYMKDNNNIELYPLIKESNNNAENKWGREKLDKIINMKPLNENLEIEKKWKKSENNNWIKEERAILKLNYIFSILKVIDKYQE
jgi:hypothetical protein